MTKDIIIIPTKIRIGVYFEEDKYQILYSNNGYTLFIKDFFIGSFTDGILEGQYNQNTSVLDLQFINKVPDEMCTYNYYEDIIPLFKFDTKFKSSKKIPKLQTPGKYLLECTNRLGVCMEVKFEGVEKDFSCKEQIYREFIEILS